MTQDLTPEAVAKMLEGVTELSQFLRGAGPLDRLWFGDVSTKRPVFWWREHLKRIDALKEAVPALAAERDKWKARAEAAEAENARLRTPAGAAAVLLQDGDTMTHLSIVAMRNNRVKDGKRIGYQPASEAALQRLVDDGDEPKEKADE
jgi:hypothetical protein